MDRRKILVVDDEKDTRHSLEVALAPLGYEVESAASGQEALEYLSDPEIGMMLLDLRMSGVGGLDVLRQVERERPDVRVVILAEEGTVGAAVESMKHGAVDVLQKPLVSAEVRDLVRGQLDPARQRAAKERDYDRVLAEARKSIRNTEFDVALAHLRRATERDPGRPEAFNLLGVVHELRHDRVEAQRHYRLALELDPTYGPARENLETSTREPSRRGAPVLGEDAGESPERADE